MKYGVSEFVRCRSEIKMMGISVVFFLIALIVVSTISTEDLLSIIAKPVVGSTAPVVSGTSLDSSKNKVMAAGILAFFAILFLLSSVVFSTKNGCYKTSIFGILIGLLTGMF